VYVRLYKPAKSASQSGYSKSKKWLIEPFYFSKRSPDNLMGWYSATDTRSELEGRLSFNTKAEAINFIHYQGWIYKIESPSDRRIISRNYLNNFKICRPEDEERLILMR
jgi:hypothetical protein